MTYSAVVVELLLLFPELPQKHFIESVVYPRMRVVVSLDTSFATADRSGGGSHVEVANRTITQTRLAHVSAATASATVAAAASATTAAAGAAVLWHVMVLGSLWVVLRIPDKLSSKGGRWMKI